MAINRKLRKLLFLSLVLAAGAGLLVLLLVAISKKKEGSCTGVVITINGPEETRFVSRDDILGQVTAVASPPLRGKPLLSFNLKTITAAVEKNSWIKNAQVYFDNTGKLRIVVGEKIPVARIFSVSGESFYIDSSGEELPLNSKVVLKLPVFTGFPVNRGKMYGSDSVLLAAVKGLSRYLLQDAFWMAQVGQVEITPERTFNIIPVIGNHIIVFGTGDHYADKFHRLFLFYRQVSAKVGMDKYAALNVAFSGQVVATRKGATGKIDSLQALKNIRELIDASNKQMTDSVSTMVDNNIVLNATPSPILKILNNTPPAVAATDSVHLISKVNISRQPAREEKQDRAKAHSPTAVMKKNNGIIN